MFEAKITVGNLLEIFTFAFGALMFILELRSRLQILQLTQENFDKQLGKLQEEVVLLAKNSIVVTALQERLNAQSDRMLTIERKVEKVGENHQRTYELLSEHIKKDSLVGVT
jgi:hypothetical protein